VNRPFEIFRYCPKCGEGPVTPPVEPVFRCAACGFVFFFNPAAAAGAFLHDDTGRLLFLRRAKEPARGKLALAGGFIDYDETAEAGLRREIREEIGLEVGSMDYLCSEVNRYRYLDIDYPVVDLFFTAAVPADARPQKLDGVDDLCWVRPEELLLEDLAFPSIRAAFRRLEARGSGHGCAGS